MRGAYFHRWRRLLSPVMMCAVKGGRSAIVGVIYPLTGYGQSP